MTLHRTAGDASPGAVAGHVGGLARPPYLEVEEVGKQLGTFVALHRINLSLESVQTTRCEHDMCTSLCKHPRKILPQPTGCACHERNLARQPE